MKKITININNRFHLVTWCNDVRYKTSSTLENLIKDDFFYYDLTEAIIVGLK